jgi:hypothetical protein
VTPGGEQRGGEVDEVLDEEAVVGVRRRGGSPPELGGAEADGGEPPVQAHGFGVEERLDQHAPAVDRVGGVRRVGVDERLGRVDQLGVDLQVLGSAVGVGQLGGEGPHQRAGEVAQLGGIDGLAVVEHGVTAGLDVGPVLGEHGGEHALAVLEVVLHRRGALGPGLAVDLAQAHRRDPVGRRRAVRRR